jgi:hypothetical protein
MKNTFVLLAQLTEAAVAWWLLITQLPRAEQMLVCILIIALRRTPCTCRC